MILQQGLTSDTSVFCGGITILSTQLPSMDASGYSPQEKMSFEEKGKEMGIEIMNLEKLNDRPLFSSSCYL